MNSFKPLRDDWRDREALALDEVADTQVIVRDIRSIVLRNRQ
jgi:hypothetical protein